MRRDKQQNDVKPLCPPALEISSRQCHSRAPSGPGPGATTIVSPLPSYKIVFLPRYTKISEFRSAARSLGTAFHDTMWALIQQQLDCNKLRIMWDSWRECCAGCEAAQSTRFLAHASHWSFVDGKQG
ncbi:hypothetical protein CROQUDRAFT_96140 [Cronartium quercuum f. sp. fusiforme G11]|uniref:Uncharacterized protein n=1 Tax=Cronartium quercuum f. sp. fusiforme G11 TaxID=708437 RepID=A0A9P6NCF0_9BASI|nr:hypothetical protein CROQUDRAFT_96140 [Cronartium quercuum f. sp. fusiforme G11]